MFVFSVFLVYLHVWCYSLCVSVISFLFYFEGYCPVENFGFNSYCCAFPCSPSTLVSIVLFSLVLFTLVVFLPCTWVFLLHSFKVKCWLLNVHSEFNGEPIQLSQKQCDIWETFIRQSANISRFCLGHRIMNYSNPDVI